VTVKSKLAIINLNIIKLFFYVKKLVNLLLLHTLAKQTCKFRNKITQKFETIYFLTTLIKQKGRESIKNLDHETF